MDGHVFAKRIAVSDAHFTRHRLAESEILRRCADNSAVADKVLRAEDGRALQNCVGLNHASRAKPDSFSDHCVRADLDVFGQFRFAINDGGRMNLHNTPASRKLK